MGMNVEMHSEVISDIQLTITFLNLLLILAQARIVLCFLINFSEHDHIVGSATFLASFHLSKALILSQHGHKKKLASLLLAFIVLLTRFSSKSVSHVNHFHFC